MKTKKLLCLLLVVMLLLSGCGKKTLTCDGCGREITVNAGSDVTDEWILYCAECEQKLGDIVPVE